MVSSSWLYSCCSASQDPHFPVVHKMPGSGIGGSTRGGFSQLQMDILDGNDETLDPRDFLPCESRVLTRSYRIDIWLTLPLCSSPFEQRIRLVVLKQISTPIWRGSTASEGRWTR